MCWLFSVEIFQQGEEVIGKEEASLCAAEVQLAARSAGLQPVYPREVYAMCRLVHVSESHQNEGKVLKPLTFDWAYL